MKNDGYYILFFICVGLLIILFYNQYSQQPSPLQPVRLPTQPTQKSPISTQSLHQYHTQQDQQMKKKTENEEDYTYNIENINIHKDNLNVGNNENKLGLGTANAANAKYEPELEEVYSTTLRGDEYDTESSDEIYNYSIKPNKSDLPIVNPPLQLLRSNAPLRLSERHLV
jgi:hypothetical protein